MTTNTITDEERWKQLYDSLEEIDTGGRDLVTGFGGELPLAVLSRAVEVHHELDARYWACRQFLKDGDYAPEDAHHTLAMNFALRLPEA